MSRDAAWPDLAEAARQALDRYLVHERAAPHTRELGLSRRIAFAAIYFAACEGVASAEAMDLAALLFRQEGRVSYAYFRKCKSEARAVVEAVLAEHGAQLPSASETGLLEKIGRVLAQVSLDEVTRRRAGRLNGARGGPRAAAEMKVLRALRTLERRALAGDHHAARELEAILRHLGVDGARAGGTPSRRGSEAIKLAGDE